MKVKMPVQSNKFKYVWGQRVRLFQAVRKKKQTQQKVHLEMCRKSRQR